MQLVEDEFVALDIVAPVQAPAIEAEAPARHVGRAAAEGHVALQPIDACGAVEPDRDRRRQRRVEARERPEHGWRQERPRAHVGRAEFNDRRLKRACRW